MRPDSPALGTADGDASVDPLADLLFTLIAAVLPAILLLAPSLERANRAIDQSAETAHAAEARATTVTVEGRPAHVIVAEAAGLRVPGREPVPLDAIPDDADLRRRLVAWRNGGEPLLLVVEPDGFESAFLLEPVLAASGLEAVEELRAPETCSVAHAAALKAACAAAGA